MTVMLAVTNLALEFLTHRLWRWALPKEVQCLPATTTRADDHRKTSEAPCSPKTSAFHVRRTYVKTLPQVKAEP